MSNIELNLMKMHSLHLKRNENDALDSSIKPLPIEIQRTQENGGNNWSIHSK